MWDKGNPSARVVPVAPRYGVVRTGPPPVVGQETYTANSQTRVYTTTVCKGRRGEA